MITLEGLYVLLYIAMLVILYFFPACLAVSRKHCNALAIFALNAFLGWTGLGWGVALIWACTSNVRQTAES